jgi:hypothetical protein
MISHFFCDEEDHFNALPANLSCSKSTSKGTSNWNACSISCLIIGLIFRVHHYVHQIPIHHVLEVAFYSSSFRQLVLMNVNHRNFDNISSTLE